MRIDCHPTGGRTTEESPTMKLSTSRITVAMPSTLRGKMKTQERVPLPLSLTNSSPVLISTQLCGARIPPGNGESSMVFPKSILTGSPRHSTETPWTSRYLPSGKQTLISCSSMHLSFSHVFEELMPYPTWSVVFLVELRILLFYARLTNSEIKSNIKNKLKFKTL